MIIIRGGMGLWYIGSGRVQNMQKFQDRVGSGQFARDTQVPTNYCALLYKPRLTFKPKNPLSIYQARPFM